MDTVKRKMLRACKHPEITQAITKSLVCPKTDHLSEKQHVRN